MTRRQSTLFLAVLLLPTPAVATGRQPPARGQPERDEIASHIARLGSPEFGERGAAAKALDRLGGRALPALRARCRPALVRSEMVIRSCSASVAMIEITTSRIMPQESKKGSVKLRHATPYESSCSR